MAHHTLQSLDGASPGIGGLSMKTLVQNMTLITEMNFGSGFIKTKHAYHGTQQIMGHLVSVQSKYSVLCPSVV